MCNLKAMLNNERGEAYVGEAVKIIIAVVLGALLIAGLVALFNKVIMPTIEEKVEGLFAYDYTKGASGTFAPPAPPVSQ